MKPKSSALIRRIKRYFTFYKVFKAYDAATFWEKRHRRYKSDFRSVANEAGNNRERYEKQKEQFLRFLEDTEINISGIRCLEFGCGNGFWGEMVLSQSACSYHGLDISKTAVKNCRKKIPKGTFECLDASVEKYEPPEPADLVFSIDVAQHIVEEEKLAMFLCNISTSARQGGYILITSYTGCGDKYADKEKEYVIAKALKIPKLRWVHTWDVKTLSKYIPGCTLIRMAEFWDKTILAFVKERTSDK